MTKTQERIIDLSIEIKELRVRLDDKLQELDLLVSGDGGVQASKTVKPKAPRKPSGPRAGGIPARVLAKLESGLAVVYTADELAGELALQSEEIPALRAALSRLVREGKIASPETGKYQAKGGE